MAPALFRAATLALRAAASICPASPTCPQDDQCTTTTNGVSLQISCTTDYYGGDLQLAQTSTLSGCISACAATTRCVAASYVAGDCYMKSVLNAASENANVIGVAVTSREISTPGTGSDKQTCPASFTCPENNGCSYSDGSRNLVLSCGVDFYGGDYANQYAESFQACTKACAADTQCAAASFVGGKGAGTCYLKATENGATINENVNAIYVVTAAVQTSSTSSSTSVTDSSSASAASSSTTSSLSAIESPSASVAISSIATSSFVTATTSFVALPSSTFVPSSTSTSSSATPRPTCDSSDSGTNLIANPSFELNTGTGSGKTSTSWTSSSSSVYPVSLQSAAHTGKAYMVFLSRQQNGFAVAASQKIPSALDTSRSYAASFYLNPYQGSVANECTVQLYANDAQIFSQAITYFSNAVNYVKYVSPVFTPSSPDVTVKLQFKCTTGTSSFIADDVSVTAACA